MYDFKRFYLRPDLPFEEVLDWLLLATEERLLLPGFLELTEPDERLLLRELLELTAFLGWSPELLELTADLVLPWPEELLELTDRVACGDLETFLLETFAGDR